MVLCSDSKPCGWAVLVSFVERVYVQGIDLVNDDELRSPASPN